MLVDLIRSAIVERCEGNVGVVLSGGIDSSTVACLAPRPLPSFTGWYDEPGFDERHFARLAARGEHHEIEIGPEDFVEHFDAMAEHVRPPVQGMGTFGQYMVARYVSQHVNVVLSGEGSDELFGGYARQMIVAGMEPPPGYEAYELPPDYPRKLEAALAYDLARLPDLLAVDDQMTRAFGVEARAPFTDERIVAWALAHPAWQRVGKGLLRDAVRGIVPDEILARRDKMGFPAPLVAWAQREPVRSFVGDRIGYVPDPERPWDRAWWYDMFREREEAAA